MRVRLFWENVKRLSAVVFQCVAALSIFVLMVAAIIGGALLPGLAVGYLLWH